MTMIGKEMRVIKNQEPGMLAYDAEMIVETEEGDTIFLHANYFDGERFTVSYKSKLNSKPPRDPERILGNVPMSRSVDLEKEFESLSATKESDYYKGFKELDALVDEYIKLSTTRGSWEPLVKKDLRIDLTSRKNE